ncbi:unnamed protein product [Rotaria sp. Silwood2]|nr:unnamed protein product [Rotaria sp. Silwood2]
MEASSLQSKNISTTQTTTLNLTTSSTRSSLPSQEKITKKNETNCEACGNRWSGNMSINKREGLLLILSFQCSICQNIITIETSSKIVASDRRDINVRSQIGGHLCDIRYAGLVKLMGAMNLPIKSFTGRSMKKAVEETVAAENGTELMVSGDGFWQTRGFQSRHGAAALLSCNTPPKVLDIETCNVLSIKKSNPAKYDNIIRSHRCEKNYEKSSGTMESAAILTMFKRSVSKYGVYYTKYVGDGDSKTFPVLSKILPYLGIIYIFDLRIFFLN